jgi:N-formylglutamate deformylase
MEPRMSHASKDMFHLEPPEGHELPLLVSIPHTGEELSPGLAERMASDTVRALPDTDFHLHRLYDFVPRLGARLLYARFSRYVIDLNRPEDQAPLYPGRSETGLVPTSSFAGEPLYRPGELPSASETDQRIATYYRPYHERLARELRHLKQRHGYALLFDAHSIKSVVPRFFEGELPGLMLGDVDGSSCDERVADAVYDVHVKSGYSYGRNNPFKGGHITRAYGRPAEGVHALQLEMSQRLYMNEDPPFSYDEAKASKLRPVLEATLRTFVESAARAYARTTHG